MQLSSDVFGDRILSNAYIIQICSDVYDWWWGLNGLLTNAHCHYSMYKIRADKRRWTFGESITHTHTCIIRKFCHSSEDALSRAAAQSAAVAASVRRRSRREREQKLLLRESHARIFLSGGGGGIQVQKHLRRGEASAFSLIFIMVARDDSSWMTWHPL